MEIEHPSLQRRMEKAAVSDPRVKADCGKLSSYIYWSSAPCLLLSHALPILCSLCYSLLIDHQLQIWGWLPIRNHHGNAELLLNEGCSGCLSLHFTLELKDSLLPITTHGVLSACWRPVTSLKVANFPECLTICSVLLTMCLCCQSRGGKNQSTSYFC